MRIIIGGDIVPTGSNFALFESGASDELIGTGLAGIISDADLTVFNLEVPLTDSISPIKKRGPCLAAPSGTINGLKKINGGFFTLANNHIMDQGEAGLRSTLKLLNDSGIAHAGAGMNPGEAKKPYIIEKNGMKIGIYACAEHEFSIACGEGAGANPFDMPGSLRDISRLKEQCAFVIVLYHGGREHYRYPSPDLRKVCRAVIDAGADLTVCQHSHCIGCEEKYNGGTIVYGQGNFLFDATESEYWQTSMLVRLDDSLTVDYIPLIKQKNKVRLAGDEEAREIRDAFEKRGEQIKEPGFTESTYREFAMSGITDYLITASGMKRGLFTKVIDRLTGHRFTGMRLKMRYNEKSLLALENLIECEAHRELFLAGIKSLRENQGLK